MIKRYCNYCHQDLEKNRDSFKITNKLIKQVKMGLFIKSKEELLISGDICDKCYNRLNKVLNMELEQMEKELKK